MESFNKNQPKKEVESNNSENEISENNPNKLQTIRNEISANTNTKKDLETENNVLNIVESKLNNFIGISDNSSKELQKTEDKPSNSIESKLNNLIGANDNSSKPIQRTKKIRTNGEEYDFSCSIDEERTNWRGAERIDRRKCYVNVFDDRLVLDKTGIMINSDLGSRTIYFSDISSIDFDKSGVFHVTNSIKLIMRGGEYLTLLYAGPSEFDLVNEKWSKYKENQNKLESQTFNQNSPHHPVSNADELMKYAELFEKGLLTEDEFNLMKQKLLGNSAESSAKFCGNCGAEIIEDSKFCTQCGSRIK